MTTNRLEPTHVFDLTANIEIGAGLHLTDDAQRYELILKGHGTSYRGNWPNVNAIVDGTAGRWRRRRPLLDFAYVEGHWAVTERTVTLLRDALEGDGEFLPILTQKETFFVFNCTTILDALDPVLSACRRLVSGDLVSLAGAVFSRSAIDGHCAFRQKGLLGGETLVSAEVLKIVEENQLTGYLAKPYPVV